MDPASPAAPDDGDHLARCGAFDREAVCVVGERFGYAITANYRGVAYTHNAGGTWHTAYLP